MAKILTDQEMIEIIRRAPDEIDCEDCGNMFGEDQGRPYKYEKDIWLCDDCHDRRMEEN